MNRSRKILRRSLVIALLAAGAFLGWRMVLPPTDPDPAGTNVSESLASAVPAPTVSLAPTATGSATTALVANPSATPSGPSVTTVQAPGSASGSVGTVVGPRKVPPGEPVDYRTHYVLVDGHKAHPTRILARFKPEAGLAERREALDVHELGVLEEFGLVQDSVVLDVMSDRPGPVLDREEAQRRGEAMLDRIKALQKSGRFVYVEPDYVVQASLLPTDTAFTDGTLWGLRNTGQNSGVSGADIDAVRAWDITTGSTNVVVAVIDSGIRYTHNDLADQMWRNPGEIPGNGIDDDGDGYVDNVFGINAVSNNGNPNDDNDHGTHCAGTIGAAANSGGRHVGVAWNVRLMACKFLNAEGSGALSDSVKCINFAVQNGAQIINASFGGGGFSQSVFDAITAARNASVLFVAAAGNESNNNDNNPAYPASYNIDNILSVAAIDRQDKLATFSNFGASRVHLGAPGVSIFSAARGSNTEYKTFDGTSMAAPHVCGVAALVLAQHPNSSLASLRQRLVSSVVRTDALRGRTITGGRVNARAALTLTPDDRLEIEVNPSEGVRLTGGVSTPFFVRVTDLDPIVNATVSTRLPSGITVNFRNDGVSPDLIANDGSYSANIVVPGNTNRLVLAVIATAPGKIAITNEFSWPVIGPIPNDAFANRSPINGLNATIQSHNIGATFQAGEPRHAGSPGGRSIWWTWTAPASGTVNLTTAGSDFDTLLAVYTGSALNALQSVGSDDDSGPGTTSQVTFQAFAGITYQIAVDGYGGAQGLIQLALTTSGVAQAPPNDAFSARTPLTGASVNVTGSNIAATSEDFEPTHAGNPGGRSAWWSWTAPLTGLASIDTDPSSFNTLLAVYTGTALNSLTPVTSDDDGGEGDRSRVVFPVVSGVVYQIAVDGFNGAQGSIGLHIEATIPPPPPQNDFFSQRAGLSGAEATGLGDTRTATREAGEPDHAGNSGGGSVWWSWTAPRDGRVNLSTSGSNFDTLLAVYTGSGIANLTPVASNDDDPNGGSTSRVAFDVSSGVTYHFAVDGRNTGLSWSTGNVVLNLSLGDISTGPANDNFANSTPFAGGFANLSGNNFGASAEPGEPNHVGAFGSRSVWWSWTAPDNGVATIDTSGSSFDTVLAVYVGSSVSALTFIAADDDSGSGNTSRASFNAIAGATYRIAIDGFLGAEGSIELALTQVAAPPGPANDNFAEATPLPASGGVFPSVNDNATREPGEPSHAGQPGGSSVWWTWTAATSAFASINTSGSSFDTLLAIYTGDSLGNLSLVAASDDTFTFTSAVDFRTVADTTYHIAVDGFGGAFGDIQLEVLPDVPIVSPLNDTFVNRSRLPADGALIDTSNIGATSDPSEPAHTGQSATRSLWWSWTAPTNGSVTLSTGDSSIDTVLAVYTGATLSSLSGIAANDDSPTDFTSKLTFTAVQGTEYQIAVDGFGGETGPIRLSLLFTPTVVFPPDAHEPDDTAAQAGLAINGQTQVRSLHRVGDTDWVRFTISGAATDVQIETSGSSGDTEIRIFHSSDLNRFLGYDDDSGPGGFARLQLISLDPGTYYARISDFGNDSPIGSYTLRVSWSAGVVSGNADRYEPDNLFSTAKPIGNGDIQGRSIHAVGNQDWARFTLASPATNVRIETDGPSGDTEVWLYGPDTTATTIGYDDDGGFDLFSRIRVPSLATGTYYIRVRAFGNSVIPLYVLVASWTESLPPAPPDLSVSSTTDDSSVVLRLSGTPGRTYRIEVQNSLNPAQWDSLTTVSLTESSQEWTDAVGSGSTQRFYRAVLAP